MKTCKFCNSTLEDGAVFCTGCGKRCDEAYQAYEQPQYQQPQYEQPQYQQPQYQQPQYQQPQYQQPPYPQANQSYFDGTLLQQIGWSLLMILLTVCTCGLGFPWAYCLLLKWQTKHTVVDGRRLVFDGTGGQLFGKWILWSLLTLITFGIYSFWLGIKMKQWVTSHTHFMN